MRRALPGPETSDYATLIRPTDYIEVTVLAAWCELRDDFRHFRTDRIVACHETGDSFADLAPRLRRDWHARLGMPCQGRDGG